MENPHHTTSSSPAPRKHSDNDLLDILKNNEELTHLEAFAKKQYGLALENAVKDDEKQRLETRGAENFVRPASLVSMAVLRAIGSIKK